jgi:hypothetical protein
MTFTETEVKKFETRFEEGYDVTSDRRYNRWLQEAHPGSTVSKRKTNWSGHSPPQPVLPVVKKKDKLHSVRGESEESFTSLGPEETESDSELIKTSERAQRDLEKVVPEKKKQNEKVPTQPRTKKQEPPTRNRPQPSSTTEKRKRQTNKGEKTWETDGHPAASRHWGKSSKQNPIGESLSIIL